MKQFLKKTLTVLSVLINVSIVCLVFVGNPNTVRKVHAEPSITPTPFIPLPNDKVNDIVQGPDGTIYIGGEFSYLGPSTGNGVTVNLSNGLLTGTYPFVNYDIFAVVPDGSGGWFIGGDFWEVGGVSLDRLAHILPNGTVDAAWNPNPDDTVFDLVLVGNTLYVSGYFLQVNGQPRNSIAAIDVSSTASVNLTAWDPNANAPVLKMAVNGTTLYAGGQFTSIGGQTRNHIAALQTNVNTNNATSWNPDADYDVSEVYIYTDPNTSVKTLYVGGIFQNIGGQNYPYAVALNMTTGLADSWHFSTTGKVNSIVRNGNYVYIGGFYSSPRRNLAEVDATTGVATSWDPRPTGSLAKVDKLFTYNNILYVGGNFDNILSDGINPYSGVPRSGMVAFDLTNHSVVQAWEGAANDHVFDFGLNGSTMYIGGSFTSAGGVSRRYAAAFDPNTGAILPWNPSPDDFVRDIAVNGNTVYLAGDFGHVDNGIARNYLASVDATTGAVTSWNPNMDQEVWAVEVDPTTGTIFAGGPFDNVGGQPRAAFAAFNSSGSLLTGYPNDFDGQVRHIIVNGGIVYLDGDFSVVGGQTRHHLAALNISNGTPTSWNPMGSSFGGGFINTIEFSVDKSLIYIGGEFTNINGTSRTHLAAVNTSDGNLTAWNPVTDTPNGEVRSISPTSTVVYVSGEFSTINSVARHYVAALDPTTGTPTVWDPGIVGNLSGPTIWKVLAVGNSVYVGGTFDQVGNDLWNFFARFDEAALPTPTPTVTATPTVSPTTSLTASPTASITTTSSGNGVITTLPNTAIGTDKIPLIIGVTLINFSLLYFLWKDPRQRREIKLREWER